MRKRKSHQQKKKSPYKAAETFFKGTYIQCTQHAFTRYLEIEDADPECKTLDDLEDKLNYLKGQKSMILKKSRKGTNVYEVVLGNKYRVVLSKLDKIYTRHNYVKGIPSTTDLQTIVVITIIGDVERNPDLLRKSGDDKMNGVYALDQRTNTENVIQYGLDSINENDAKRIFGDQSLESVKKWADGI